jgi:hypothetical protein
MIEHRDHKTINISRAKDDKQPELSVLRKELDFKQERFNIALQDADKEVEDFEKHVFETEHEMMKRKGDVMTKVDESFNVATHLVEQTGQKQAELNKQSQEIKREVEFLKLAASLAEQMSNKGAPALAAVRAWKGLDVILRALNGEDDKGRKAALTDDIVPQRIIKKRLVLPAPNCMTPDLRILQKVGVEGSVLRKSFVLKVRVFFLSVCQVLFCKKWESMALL